MNEELNRLIYILNETLGEHDCKKFATPDNIGKFELFLEYACYEFDIELQSLDTDMADALLDHPQIRDEQLTPGWTLSKAIDVYERHGQLEKEVFEKLCVFEVLCTYFEIQRYDVELDVEWVRHYERVISRRFGLLYDLISSKFSDGNELLLNLHQLTEWPNDSDTAVERIVKLLMGATDLRHHEDQSSLIREIRHTLTWAYKTLRHCSEVRDQDVHDLDQGLHKPTLTQMAEYVIKVVGTHGIREPYRQSVPDVANADLYKAVISELTQ